MRKTHEQTLKQAIEQLLDFYKIRGKVAETKVINSWEELMGKVVANHTTEISIRNRKMFLKLDSSVLKSEMIMIRSDIIKRINDKAEKSIIDEIVFL